MPSIASLILRSAQLARLEGRTMPLQPMLQGSRALEASAVCLRPSSDVAYIPTLFSNIGLCRAKRRESLCYPRDMVGLHRSCVTMWRAPSQQ
jgi:hypothetical protein